MKEKIYLGSKNKVHVLPSDAQIARSQKSSTPYLKNHPERICGAGKGLAQEELPVVRENGKFCLPSLRERPMYLSPQDPSGKVVKEPSLGCRSGRGSRREGKSRKGECWGRGGSIRSGHTLGQDGLKGAVNVATRGWLAG
ncbi:hypothetical protein RUM44_002219 [Polyplax serrata]|uniref:Uncharacterized protein n=1 Tax=Polyplax serrata TaxID=468196 RepID=A0ABR1AM89_POLSC